MNNIQDISYSKHNEEQGSKSVQESSIQKKVAAVVLALIVCAATTAAVLTFVATLSFPPVVGIVAIAVGAVALIALLVGTAMHCKGREIPVSITLSSTQTQSSKNLSKRQTRLSLDSESSLSATPVDTSAICDDESDCDEIWGEEPPVAQEDADGLTIPQALNSSATLQFPSRNEIVTYLKKHLSTEEYSSSEEEVIDALANAFDKRNKIETDVNIEVARILKKWINVKLSRLTAELLLKQLKECADAEKPITVQESTPNPAPSTILTGASDASVKAQKPTSDALPTSDPKTLNSTNQASESALEVHSPSQDAIVNIEAYLEKHPSTRIRYLDLKEKGIINAVASFFALAKDRKETDILGDISQIMYNFKGVYSGVSAKFIRKQLVWVMKDYVAGKPIPVETT